MPLTTSHVHAALRTVNDPDLNKDLVTLNMVKDVRVTGGSVAVTIELTTPACPMKDRIRQDVERAVRHKAGEVKERLDSVDVHFTADVRPANRRLHEQESPLPNVRHIVAVGAGKGGVGKSTASVLLALGLARTGARVGLLDGDIYGPSISTMLGLQQERPVLRGNMLDPFVKHGVRAMTMAKLVEPDKALIWRGPMAHGAFKQLATQTEWGELDYLIVDLPPGTGDVPLTLAQLLPLTGAVVVCTPQRVALDDARRAVRMFQQLGVAVLGLIENMSFFVCDHGTEYDIFGRGGAAEMARSMELPFLGAVPIHVSLRRHCDAGTPDQCFEGESPLARELTAVCGALAAQISIVTHSGRLIQPTLSVRAGD
jgi:ATP-binding protein involved in chromosome partitioning